MKMRKSRGAASIIVIFMIMVLFVFGMLSLTTALANSRLSVKSASWVKEYYQVERLAEQLIMEVDACLETAELRAREFVVKQGSDFEGFKSYEDEMHRFFYYFACEELERLPQEYVDEVDLDKARYADRSIPVEEILTPLVYLEISVPGVNKHILAAVQAVYPEYRIAANANPVNGSRVNPDEPRFEIIEWREWQKPFDYNQPLDFWNGSADGNTP